MTWVAKLILEFCVAEEKNKQICRRNRYLLIFACNILTVQFFTFIIETTVNEIINWIDHFTRKISATKADGIIS